MRLQGLMYHLGYPSGIGRVAEYHPNRLFGGTPRPSQLRAGRSPIFKPQCCDRGNTGKSPENSWANPEAGRRLAGKSFSIQTVAPQNVVCGVLRRA